MEVLFRAMGLVAGMSARMSRFRVNFIPSNLGLMTILLVVFLTCSGGAATAFASGGTPATVRLVDLLAHKTPGSSYVRVTGNLYSGAVLQATYGKSKDAPVTKTWMPLVDGSGKRALLVERNSAAEGNGSVETVELTGMLEPMDSDLRAKLNESGGKLDNLQVDTEYTLAESSSPGNPWLYSLAALGSGVLLGLFLLTFAMQYVVFRRVAPEPGMPVAAGEGEACDLRVTGSFILDGPHRQRFLNMPAGMGQTETGEVLFVSNIDASNRFMGITTSNRQGYWVVPIQPGTVDKLDYGRLYIGLAARPAVRFRYREPEARCTQTAVLSFGTEAERMAAVRDLQSWLGFSA